MKIPLRVLGIVNRIVGASKERLKFGSIKKGAIRFNKTNPKELDIDLFTIISNSQLEIKIVLPPKETNSASSKFLTYVVVDIFTNGEYVLVFANGGNNGHHFEYKIEDDLKKVIASSALNIHPLLNGLANLSAISIDPTHYLAPINIQRINMNPPKRSLSLDLVDVGPIIADVSMQLRSGEVLYLSLKNIEGSTFANTGISKAFKQAARIESVISPIDPIFETFGINRIKIAHGCNAYQYQEYYPKEVDNYPNINELNALTYIRSGFGFGYWYVREQRSQEYQIINLVTMDKLKEFVPDIKIEKVSYPYFHTAKDCSKQCSVDLSINITDPIPNKIRIEIRNTKGGIIPTELKILKK